MNRRILVLAVLAMVLLWSPASPSGRALGPAAPSVAAEAVAPAAPLRAALTYLPSSPAAGDQVNFTASSSGGQQPYFYNWTFGDGSGPWYTGTTPTTSHVYAAQGTYPASVTVNDSANTSMSASVSVSVTAALAASFSFIPTTPDAGQTVSFTSSRSGGTSPYTYAWNFGDGSTSTLRNPTHVYTTGGTFTISLTVSDSAGHSLTVTNTIAVASGLTASFSFSPTQPVIGQPVSFFGTGNGGTPPYTYAWTFGNGNSSTLQNPTNAYATATTYTVTLTVTDAVASSAATSQPVTVVGNLGASFTLTPTQPVAGETVSFFGSATGGSPPYTYSWTFGNGNTSVSQNPTNAYAAPGTYTVMLTVRDNAGRTATSSQGITVTAGLAASFTYLPLQPSAGQAITFSGSAAGGTSPYQYSWNFGDANTSTLQNPTHAYALTGAYVVTLIVTDHAGRSASSKQTLTVSGTLTASFTFFPTKPAVNQAITFTANVSGGSPPYTDTWNFGDGSSPLTGGVVSHSYKTLGTFTVTLSVQDSVSHGTSSVGSVLVTLGLSADFTSSQPHPVTGENVTFNATAGGGTAPYNYSWDFGDGNMSVGQEVIHAFALATTFYVVLTVTDAAGHSAIANHSIAVKAPVYAAFTFTPILPLTFEVINFTATASYGFPPYTYDWNFGDGSTGSGIRVGHGYNSAGNYTVTLTATDSANHKFVTSENITVALLLAAGIDFTPSLPVVGQVVNFTGTARGANPPYTFSWNFGDAVSAVGQNVTHAYSQAKSYTVTLKVVDSAGRSTTVYQTVVVSSGFAASFTFSPSDPFVGQAVSFTGAGSGGLPPYTFNWTFGDGINASGASVSHTYSASGNFTITLTVYDSSGHNASDKEVVSVTSVLHANFTFAPTDPVDGQSIPFNGTVSGGSPPYTFQWSFGDGATSVGQNVSHAYAAAKTFKVTMTVTDFVGHLNRVIQSVVVGPSVKALITIAPDRPLLDQPVSFEAVAAGGAGNYTYLWDFGDGHSAEGAWVNHTYDGVGLTMTRVVTLTVCDSEQRCSTVSETIILESVFSIALLGEGAIVVLVAAYWIIERRRRRGLED